MKSFKLGDVVKITEAVAVVGIILSMVSLAVRIRQNTKAIHAASYQNVATGINDFQLLLAQNESLARIFLKGAQDPSQLNPEERLRFEMAMGALFSKFDVALDLYRRRMIDDEAMTPYTRVILIFIKSPGIADWWKNNQDFYNDETRSFINDKINP